MNEAAKKSQSSCEKDASAGPMPTKDAGGFDAAVDEAPILHALFLPLLPLPLADSTHEERERTEMNVCVYTTVPCL